MKKNSKKISINPELEKKVDYLEVKINEFGEIVTSYNPDDINAFLDKELYDKKIGNKEAKTGSLKEKHFGKNNEQKK